jgi:hypothetical protein
VTIFQSPTNSVPVVGVSLSGACEARPVASVHRAERVVDVVEAGVDAEVPALLELEESASAAFQTRFMSSYTSVSVN